MEEYLRIAVCEYGPGTRAGIIVEASAIIQDYGYSESPQTLWAAF